MKSPQSKQKITEHNPAQTYRFVVSDEAIDLAADILHEAGLRRVKPDDSAECQGVFGTTGHYFVSPYDPKRQPTRLHILPQSLVHLEISDADLSPKWLDLDLQIYRPRLPELCVALMRCIDDYPAKSRNRSQPRIQLRVLIAIGAYKEEGVGGKIWVPEEETESEADFQIRKAKAIEDVRSWPLREGVEQYRERVVEAVRFPREL